MVPAHQRRHLRAGRLLSEPFAAFALPLVAYLIVGALLDFEYHSWIGDAVARMANAFYVLHSGDPHLAALGFVWNPLPSLVQLPILLFTSAWPALVHDMYSASIASAAAMAGAVYQLRCLLNDWGVALDGSFSPRASRRIRRSCISAATV